MTDDVQDVVRYVVDAARGEVDLRVLDNVEELGRAQMLVARCVAGVDTLAPVVAALAGH
jgi:hypothetical protein